MPTSSSQLERLLDDHWQAWLRYDPLFASQTGDHRYDDRLPDISDSALQAWRTQLQGYLERLKGIDREPLTPDERLNADVFSRLIQVEVDELGFGYYRMPISRTGGFHLSMPDLPVLTRLESQQDFDNYLSRLSEMLTFFRQAIELMRLGLKTGYLPPQATLQDIEEELTPHLVQDPTLSAFYLPFKQLPDFIPDADKESLARKASQVIKDSIIPAYRELLAFVQDEYQPAARPGIAASELPDGRRFYESRIRYFTSLSLTPEEVHATGQEEVKRIRDEMQALMTHTGFNGELKQYIQSLRDDPRFYAATPEALLKETSLVLKRIDGELPRLFKTLPRLPYGIKVIPDFSAPGNTTAYYMPGAGDGTRAGAYYVNTYDLKSRPFYEIEALSLHEAVPGHHLQIALQQELSGLPNFRRYNGFTSFVEGWALYSERLGLEMGFYQDPASDFGRLSYEMWRACRLVVDTGMHALGWTRQQAIDFMLANTSSTELNIINEVDRYIAWPGQALAYKIGELKIRELRALAEKAMGTRFDVRGFHDVVLLAGAVPLDILEQRVREWMQI